MTGEHWARGSFAHSATVWAGGCAHDYCGDRHWKMPRQCGVGPERCCYDYDDDYCSTPGKPLRHFCIRRRRKMNTCLVLDEQYCYWKMPRGGGCGDGDDYEDVDCDQVARIRLRLVLLACEAYYVASIDTCYCWPDILVDVIGTIRRIVRLSEGCLKTFFFTFCILQLEHRAAAGD